MAVKRQENIDVLIVSGSASIQDNQVNDVANGTALTDAVNLQQLNAVAVGQGWDEAVFDKTTGNLKFLIATVLDETVNLDDRYPTTAQVTALIAAGSQTVFTLNMPAATTVQGRIDGMVEGTDYPTGWTLTASGLDLIVVHSLSRQIANTTIFTNTAGDIWQQLTVTSAFSALYSSNSDDTCQISSLATVNLPINVNIFFAT